MTQLKDDIWIEGFDEKYEPTDYAWGKDIDSKDIIYSGKTSDIPEEIAKECVKKAICIIPDLWGIYRKYSDNTGTITGIVKITKESIQSALTKPDRSIYDYCIIFKK